MKQIKTEKNNKYYDIRPIDSTNSNLNIILGQRNNGKSYALLKKALERYTKKGYKTIYLRRFELDLKNILCQNLFAGHVANGLVYELTNGEYDDVFYYNRAWYLCRYEQQEDGTEKRVKDRNPFMLGFAITETDHLRSNLQDPTFMTIIFEEFIPALRYSTADPYDECLLFDMILRSAQRGQSDDVFRIYMIANTLSYHSPYFKHFGIEHIEEMEFGTIRVYEYQTKYQMAVELCNKRTDEASEISSGYFRTFESSMNKMSTGETPFLQDEFNKLTDEIKQKMETRKRLFCFYIKENDDTIKCEVLRIPGDGVFVYCRKRTKEILNYEKDLIYCKDDPTIRNNIRKTFRKPRDTVDQKINDLWLLDRFFYIDFYTYDFVSNYIGK